MKKLPELNALYWLTKIVATTLGETGADLLSMTFDIGYAVSSMILLCFFLVMLSLQLWRTNYLPWVYWFVILATSTLGTTMSDYMDRTLGFGYAKGSLLLAIILLVVLSLWKITRKSLSVTNIQSRQSELFYWVAILVSNTLGTSLGDYLADDSGLGFAGGAILIGSALLVLIVLHYYTKISSVLLFWVAFVLTRPFGATFGDLLTKTTANGGLDFGTKGSSLLLFVLLLILLFYETMKHRKIKTLN